MTNGVTILMPVYNQGAFLTQAVDSVLAQSFPHWELIIVDDASCDDTAALAQQYASRDARVRYFRNPVNSGAATSYNVCVQQGNPTFPYLIALPGDDRWSPSLLEELVSLAHAHPDVALVHCDMQMVDADNQFIGLYSALFQDFPRAGKHQHFELLCDGNYFGHPATLVRKSAVRNSPLAAEPFLPRLVHIHDYYLWLVLMNAGATAYCLPKPLVYWRKHEGQLTSDTNRIKIFQEELVVFRELLPFLISPRFEAVRARALINRLEILGPLLLRGKRAPDALQHLREARARGAQRRLDLTVAELIASLPIAQQYKPGLWDLAVNLNRSLRPHASRP